MVQETTKDKKYIYSYPKMIFSISLILFLTMSLIIVKKIESNQIIVEKAKGSRVASDYVSALETSIYNNLSVNYTLGMLVHEWGGSIDKFEEAARHILPLYPNIANISLAPDGIIQTIYPYEINKDAIGHDLFEDKDRVTEAIKTKESARLTLAGPYQLIQGTGCALIGRLPIFLLNEDNQQEFWGFTSTVMYMDVVLDAARIENLYKIDYDYELWRKNPDTGDKEILASSGGELIDPEEQPIDLPNDRWVLAISPVGGWQHKTQVHIYIIIAFILSLLASTLLWLVSKLKISENSLEELAFFDQLTGLPNRRLFFDRIQQAMEVSKKEGSLLAVCYMDLDDYKIINDSWGHEVGDYVLKEIGKRSKDAIDKSDTIARFGGDEFVFILTNLKNRKECSKIIDKIQELTRQPIFYKDYEIKISCSIGISIYPEDGINDETLLRYADLALNDVKAKGKGQYGFY